MWPIPRKPATQKAADSLQTPLLISATKAMDSPKKTDGRTVFFRNLSRDNIDLRPTQEMSRNAVSPNEASIDDLYIPVENRIGKQVQDFRLIFDGLVPSGCSSQPSWRSATERPMARDAVHQEPPVLSRTTGWNHGTPFLFVGAIWVFFSGRAKRYCLRCSRDAERYSPARRNTGGSPCSYRLRSTVCCSMIRWLPSIDQGSGINAPEVPWYQFAV